MDKIKYLFSFISFKKSNPEAISTKKITGKISKTEIIEPEVPKEPKEQMPRTIEVLISHENFPYSKLSMETMRKLMDALVFKISNSSENQCPVFDGADICEEDGCIKIKCANEFSRSWLESELRMTSALLKHPVPVRLIDAQQSLMRLYMDSSSNLDSLEILTMLSKQNPTLNTEGWRVMAKYILPLTGHYSCQIHLLLEMDEESKQKISKLNNKAYAGFSTVQFSTVNKNQSENVIEEFRVQKRIIVPADRPIRLVTSY